MAPLEHFWSLVPAGGVGTRLWPLSRSGSPKFLHDLTGSGRSLLQATVDRLSPLAPGRVLVVTGLAHRDAVAAQLPGLASDCLLAEPSPRDSMAAIGLAAAVVERRDPDAVIGSFAADHVITQTDAFVAGVERAVAAASDGWLVTLGIVPTNASTAFGYLRLGDPLADLEGVPRVAEFVEKPEADVAQGYLDSGGFRWNAGMFVARPTVLLDLLADQDEEFAAALRAVAASPGRLPELWPRLPRIAIDHAVAEPAAAAGQVAVVTADLGWDDIGDFDSLAALLERETGALTVLGDGDLVRAEVASGLVVPGSGRMVAVVGLDDVVVVDTPDALLVTNRAHAQRVKEVVAGLRGTGHAHLA
jgi:mannose-1-phosphate guanylyltransferase